MSTVAPTLRPSRKAISRNMIGKKEVVAAIAFTPSIWPT